MDNNMLQIIYLLLLNLSMRIQFFLISFITYFQHDYPPECRPGGKIGNYIMFASATSGDRYNNNKFSDCSKANVSAVLDAIAEGRKPNCFTESNGAFCGNKIVEEGN